MFLVDYFPYFNLLVLLPIEYLFNIIKCIFDIIYEPFIKPHFEPIMEFYQSYRMIRCNRARMSKRVKGTPNWIVPAIDLLEYQDEITSNFSFISTSSPTKSSSGASIEQSIEIEANEEILSSPSSPSPSDLSEILEPSKKLLSGPPPGFEHLIGDDEDEHQQILYAPTPYKPEYINLEETIQGWQDALFEDENCFDHLYDLNHDEPEEDIILSPPSSPLPTTPKSSLNFNPIFERSPSPTDSDVIFSSDYSPTSSCSPLPFTPIKSKLNFNPIFEESPISSVSDSESDSNIFISTYESSRQSSPFPFTPKSALNFNPSFEVSPIQTSISKYDNHQDIFSPSSPWIIAQVKDNSPSPISLAPTASSGEKYTQSTSSSTGEIKLHHPKPIRAFKRPSFI
ncbi:uncharacterized protein L201_003201 [Kwoniella dendrophila CBS 6074]|uniref:Fork-head domain-containing protein n=1 Tax=Kwoniella dendrophila CBS 6074 TaxID=1295534 RepID=A0AAX4JTS4_9TREE